MVSNPSFWETEARIAVSSRPAWTVSETLCHSAKKKKFRKWTKGKLMIATREQRDPGREDRGR